MDDFYILAKPTVKKAKELITWAKKNALKTEVDVLDCKKSLARQRSDKTFEEVFNHITKESTKYLRIVLRKDWNAFLILSEEKKIMDVVEVFIRSIDIENKEYFFFIYLEVDKLKELKKKYKLKKL